MSILIKGVNKAQFLRDIWDFNFHPPEWEICEIQDDEDFDSDVIELPGYDTEEIHENVTVQVWRNTETGNLSIGWWD